MKHREKKHLKRKKKKKRTENHICGTTPETAHSDICADGVTEAREKKTIFEEIMAEKNFNLMKSTNPQIKEEGKQLTTLNSTPSRNIFQKER